MEREVGGGIGMGNTCKPIAVSFQCMTKSTTIKIIIIKIIKMRSNKVLSSGNSAHREERDKHVKSSTVECIVCMDDQLSQGTNCFSGIFTDKLTNQRSESRAASSFLYFYLPFLPALKVLPKSDSQTSTQPFAFP